MNGKWIFCKTEKWRMQKPKVKNPFICKIQFVQKGEKWTNLLSICVCVYDVSSLSKYLNKNHMKSIENKTSYISLHSKHVYTIRGFRNLNMHIFGLKWAQCDVIWWIYMSFAKLVTFGLSSDGLGGARHILKRRVFLWNFL